MVASIAGIAAIEVDGVARLTGGISKEVVSKLGKKKLAKGVEVTIVDGNVEADVSVELEYGNNIAKVSKEVQAKVKQSIETMTGLNVTVDDFLSDNIDQTLDTVSYIRFVIRCRFGINGSD